MPAKAVLLSAFLFLLNNFLSGQEKVIKDVFTQARKQVSKRLDQKK